jgi:hypothetical protein
MTTFSDDTTASIRSYADREGMTFDDAADRLVGYGLNAVNEHERFLESLKPRPYRVEYSESRTDSEGEAVLTDYTELAALPSLDDARRSLCGITTPDEDTRAAVMAAPIGHVIAIGGSYYRITKTATE